MAGSTIDLGNLLKFIVENKNIKSNLHIDHTCMIEGEDQKPLIKIFNYLINYLNQISTDLIDISLKGQSDGCLLCFIISTNDEQLPPISEKLNKALNTFNGAMRIVFEKGRYVQILINFCQGHVPETVVIDV